MNKYFDLNKDFKADFQSYIEFVNTRQPLYVINTSRHEHEIKFIYKGIYGLLTFHSKTLQGISKHLKECVYNMPIVLDLISTNNINAARLLTRNIIEQFNRYLYFYLTDGGSDTIRNMHLYLKNYFKKFKINKHVELLISEYKNLCEYVHVTEKSYFTEKYSLNEYYFNKKQTKNLSRFIKNFEKILQSILIILVSMEVKNFLRLTREDQAFIEQCILIELHDLLILNNYYTLPTTK